MKKPTTILKESVSEYREFVQLRLRMRVLEAIEVVLEEEVEQSAQALGCCSYERAERPPWISQRSRNPSRDDVGGKLASSGCHEPACETRKREKRQSSGASCCPVRAPDS